MQTVPFAFAFVHLVNAAAARTTRAMSQSIRNRELPYVTAATATVVPSTATNSQSGRRFARSRSAPKTAATSNA